MRLDCHPRLSTFQDMTFEVPILVLLPCFSTGTSALTFRPSPCQIQYSIVFEFEFYLMKKVQKFILFLNKIDYTLFFFQNNEYKRN